MFSGQTAYDLIAFILRENMTALAALGAALLASRPTKTRRAESCSVGTFAMSTRYVESHLPHPHRC